MKMPMLDDKDQEIDPFDAIREEYEIMKQAHMSKEEYKSINLPKIIINLIKIGYTKMDLAFILNVDPLTVHRWGIDGSKGVRSETYTVIMDFLSSILQGKSQHPIKVSDTGFVTWRYLVKQQELAKRIWYISSGRFVLDQSIEFKAAVQNLFVSQSHEDPGPTLVYLYPTGSATEHSLKKWQESLEKISQKPHLSGSMILIPDDNLGWFLPGMRAIMMEKRKTIREVPVEGYIRVQLQENVKKNLLCELDPLETEPHTPWLSVANNTVARWYNYCQQKYAHIIDDLVEHQKGSFQVHDFPSIVRINKLMQDK